MKITFVTRKFRNGQRNSHCDVVHITTKWVFCLTLDCNGVYAIKAYALGGRIRRFAKVIVNKVNIFYCIVFVLILVASLSMYTFIILTMHLSAQRNS